MFQVTPKQPTLDHKFIKQDKQMLKQIYGTTDVTPYWIADMDFPIAAPISAAMQHLIDRETYSYEFDSQTVFEAIAQWNKSRHQLVLDADNFVQVPGVLSAIALLIREFSNKGEGVLIQTPVYHQFRRLIESAERKVISNPLKIHEGRYEMDFEDYEQKLSSGEVKIVLLCHPHNPVGRVWHQQELQRLVAIAKKYQVMIISDEIHADIVFDDLPFTSMASLGYDNSLTIIGSPAKNFGLNSISNGYIYSDNPLLRDKIKATVSSLSLDHGNAFTTYATLAAYQQGQAWFDGYLRYTEQVRNWIITFMNEQLPQVTLFVPEGTNQIWFDFTGVGLAADTLKTRLSHQAKMALTPGSWFGETNPQYYRMNFASPLAQIQSSMALLKLALLSTEQA